jgi:hypothetical protein
MGRNNRQLCATPPAHASGSRRILSYHDPCFLARRRPGFRKLPGFRYKDLGRQNRAASAHLDRPFIDRAAARNMVDCGFAGRHLDRRRQERRIAAILECRKRPPRAHDIWPCGRCKGGRFFSGWPLAGLGKRRQDGKDMGEFPMSCGVTATPPAPRRRWRDRWRRSGPGSR